MNNETITAVVILLPIAAFWLGLNVSTVFEEPIHCVPNSMTPSETSELEKEVKRLNWELADSNCKYVQCLDHIAAQEKKAKSIIVGLVRSEILSVSKGAEIAREYDIDGIKYIDQLDEELKNTQASE